MSKRKFPKPKWKRGLCQQRGCKRPVSGLRSPLCVEHLTERKACLCCIQGAGRFSHIARHEGLAAARFAPAVLECAQDCECEGPGAVDKVVARIERMALSSL